MDVDVVTTVEIDRPIADVVADAADPDHAPEWYDNIESVEWRTEPPVAVGTQVAFVARFLGRRLAYTDEVAELSPISLVMRTAEGPFPMETSDRWDELGADRTRMTLRNRGTPTGFARVGAPVMVRAMRRANRKDLVAIKALLERPEP